MVHNSDIYGGVPDLAQSAGFSAAPPAAEQGVYLDELPLGAEIEVETANSVYRLENRGDGRAMIQGHPRYCPEPVLVDLIGATTGGAMLKMRFIGVGLRMEFLHPSLGVISTSRVLAVRQSQPA